MMKRGITFFIILVALVYFFNAYVSYFQFRIFLPKDLFIYPPDEMSRTEAATWKFILRWIIPSIIVFVFMNIAKFHKRVTINWGIILVGIVVFVSLSKLPIVYLSTFVPGGGFTFAIKALLGYLSLPSSIALLVGTIKIFMSLKPYPNPAIE